MLDEAIAFAAIAHAGQTRKYTGEPYVLHPLEVMMLVRTHAEEWTESMLVAAILHDVVEDTPVSLGTIERRFGRAVQTLVAELTDLYTSEAYPTMNRKARKAAECDRWSLNSPDAKTVKLADLISNTKSITKHDPGFARVYLQEKRRLLPLLKQGDATLYKMAHSSIEGM